jgi:hypothetical protein
LTLDAEAAAIRAPVFVVLRFIIQLSVVITVQNRKPTSQSTSSAQNGYKSI